MSLFDILLPDVPELVLSKIYYGPQRLLLFTASLSTKECCPLCHEVSEKVHSHYTRRIGDLPWADFKIELLIQVRRFYCTNQKCRRLTFAQRLGQAIPAYARRTQRRTHQLQNLGLALGGEAGARMSKSLQVPTSPDTILKLVRQLPLPPSGEVRVVGIDDFAFRRGRNYGTILVNLEDHIVIDLLADIKKETVIEWLKGHPEIEIISRDRASAFAEAGRMAAPQAVQIADRFHISKNLWETCEALIKQNYSVIRQVLGKQTDEVGPGIEGLLADKAAIRPAEEAFQTRLIEEVTSTQSVSIQPTVRERPQGSTQSNSVELKEAVALNSRERKKQETRDRRLAIYQEVMTLKERGFSKTEIAQKLGTNVTQVRRYLKGVPIHGGSVQQKTILDPYKAHLKRRFFEDHFENIKELWQEIQSQGYTGSYGGVSAYLIQVKFEQDVVELTGRPVTKRIKQVEKKLPSIRRLSWSLFLPAHRLKASQSEQLQLILTAEPKLSRGYVLVQQFTKLMFQRTDVGLTEWLIEVEGSQIEPLKSFVRGVRRDEEAVRAGLKSRWWSQGPVEGFVNKLKLVKRSMVRRVTRKSIALEESLDRKEYPGVIGITFSRKTRGKGAFQKSS